MRAWFAPAAIIIFAAALRLWNLQWPTELVFDELFYVRDAVSQLAHGYPTTWPDDDPAFGAERASQHGNDPSVIAHPPLGKWIISLGILVFGAGDGWGWRSATAIVGILTVAATMFLANRLTHTRWVALTAGLLLAVDGVHVVMSRVSILDGPLTFLVVLGAVAVRLDHEWVARGRSLFVAFRPWLLVGAALFGLAAAVKWSGLYALAGFVMLTMIRDLTVQRERGGTFARSVLNSVGLALVTAVVAAAAYVLTWLGSFRAQHFSIGEFWRWHIDMFTWHRGLEDDHPFASHPLTWPIAARPTGMFFEQLADGTVAAISPLPNVLVTWGGTAAVVILITLLVQASIVQRGALVRHRFYGAAAFVVAGALSGWLPWLAIPRSAVFQFYAVILTPFTAIALAMVLALVSSRLRAPGVTLHSGSVAGRRAAVVVYLVMAVVIGLAFWPLWSATPVPEWFRNAHFWLPGWR